MKTLITTLFAMLLLASCKKESNLPEMHGYECIIDSVHISNVKFHMTDYRTIYAPNIDSIKNIHNSECIVKFYCKE